MSNTELTKPEDKTETQAVVLSPSLQDQTNEFNFIQRKAQMLCKSDLVPAAYKGNVPNCCIALEMASRLGIDYMSYMQQSYVVNGRPGIEAKLVIAMINKSRFFAKPLRWEFFGTRGNDDYGCTCHTISALDGERVEATVSMEMAKAEGWLKNSKWKSMQDQMLCYRSATFFGRLHCPEVLSGMRTIDEIEDIIDAEYTSTKPRKELPANLSPAISKALGVSTTTKAAETPAEGPDSSEGTVPDDGGQAYLEGWSIESNPHKETKAKAWKAAYEITQEKVESKEAEEAKELEGFFEEDRNNV